MSRWELLPTGWWPAASRSEKGDPESFVTGFVQDGKRIILSGPAQADNEAVPCLTPLGQRGPQRDKMR